MRVVRPVLLLVFTSLEAAWAGLLLLTSSSLSAAVASYEAHVCEPPYIFIVTTRGILCLHVDVETGVRSERWFLFWLGMCR